ncbi:MAG: tetratricopeptide repeat protein [Planctomycetes bacterium]|nr:tetratricopeptide repeat protein [Planctomycetota bacterium]
MFAPHDAPATPTPRAPATPTPRAPAAPLAAADRRTLERLLAVGALALLVLAFSLVSVHDYDIGLHIGKGRFQIEHGPIPVPSDLLCSGFPTPVSHAEKWAFQVLVYALDRLGGPAALVVFRAAALLLLWALVFANARRQTAGAWVSCAAVLSLAVLVAEERFADRPELVTFPMAAAFALILDRESVDRSRALFLLPLLQAVWVNFHPVFILGIALCVLFLAGAALPWAAGLLAQRSRGRVRAVLAALAGWTRAPDRLGAGTRVRRLALVTLACAAASCANPDFVRGALFPVRFAAYLGPRASEYQLHVTELLSPFRYEPFPTHAVFFFKVWIGLAVVAGLLAWRRIRFVDLLLLGACFGSAWLVRRNLALCAILTAPLVARFVEDVAARALEAYPANAVRPARIGSAAVLAAGALVVWFTVASGAWWAVERHHRRLGLTVNPDHLPVRAVEWLRDAGVGGNVFASWDVGSYLLWRDFPRLVPWISTEGDHSLDLLDRYRGVMQLAVSVAEVVRAAGIEVILLRHTALDTRALVGALARDAVWTLVYADDVAVAFLRRAGPYRALAARRAAAPFAPPPWTGYRGTLPPTFVDRLWGQWRSYPEAAAHFRMSSIYGLLGNAAEEYEELSRALDRFPDYPEALTCRGANLAVAGRMEPAEADFRRALTVKPDHIPALRNLARIELGRGNSPAALAVLHRARHLDPEGPEVAFDLGRTLAELDLPEEGARVLEDLLEKSPRQAGVRRYLMHLYADVLHDAAGEERHRRALEAAGSSGSALAPSPPSGSGGTLPREGK